MIPTTITDMTKLMLKIRNAGQVIFFVLKLVWVMLVKNK